MNVETTRRVSRLLAGTAWLDQATSLVRGLRHGGHEPGELFVLGTPNHEPWHLTAHLDDAARLSGSAELKPRLLRYAPSPTAAPHLRLDVRTLSTGRGDRTVLVAAPEAMGADVLQRLSDARRSGATIFAVEAHNAELRDLAHESISLDTDAVEVIGGRLGWSVERRSDVRPAFDLTEDLLGLVANSTPGRQSGRILRTVTLRCGRTRVR
ncbi:MAG: hypothetical protein JO147_09105 [Actinobacteria bacterium]|nr:hypothetical protein [Actinomycetota bacterium]